MGVTCESFTLGHNQYKLPLSASSVFLPTLRPKFLSEHALDAFLSKEGGGRNSSSMSASALMGALGTIELNMFEDVSPPPLLEKPEFFRRIMPLWGEGAPWCETFIGQWMAYDAVRIIR